MFRTPKGTPLHFLGYSDEPGNSGTASNQKVRNPHMEITHILNFLANPRIAQRT